MARPGVLYSVQLVVVLYLSGVHPQTQNGAPQIMEHPRDGYAAKGRPFSFHCKAYGNPQPTVTWYRNGVKVTPFGDNPVTIMNDGQQLMILSVRNNNVGKFYCNATNRHGTALSRNATLETAFIRDDFQLNPEDLTNAELGSRVELSCIPPRGRPQPEISWYKNKEPVELGRSRQVLATTGSLVIGEVTRRDMGTYVCKATNADGERFSRPGELKVYGKPRIIRKPTDRVINVGEDAVFMCQVAGTGDSSHDDRVEILWEKDNGGLSSRARIQDGSLKITDAEVSDEGVYKCLATNPVGTAEAEAVLTVHSIPEFVETPVDKSVAVGRNVSLRCIVTGNPKPTVTWRKESAESLNVFPGQPQGRFHVTQGGTLRISHVTKEDAGRYVCSGISGVGRVISSATITVLDFDPRPPPVIVVGPTDVTVTTGELVKLPCDTTGEPEPRVEWSKDGKLINEQHRRFTVLSSGQLHITDVHQSDAGLYMCTAESASGETSVSATLTVTSGGTSSPGGGADPNQLPSPPSKPVISDDGISRTSVKLRWNKNEHEGTSPVTAYTVEYMSHELREGWKIASGDVGNPWFTVTDLVPNKSYVFVVKARNSYGESLPSERSDPVFTKGGDPNRPVLTPGMTTSIQRTLNNRVIRLVEAKAVSPTSMRVSWEIVKSKTSIEGVVIQYKPVGSSTDLEKRISTNNIMEYVLRDLLVYTRYEVHVRPFFWTVTGRASTKAIARTLEGVPSEPPQNIVSQWGKNRTLIVKWSPPPANKQNGVILGYKVFCLTDNPKFNRNVTTNEKGVTSVAISSLQPGHEYTVQVAAFTKAGVGVKSPPDNIGKSIGPKEESLVKKTWFIATLIGGVGGVLICGLLIFSICLYRKRRAAKARKKFHSNGLMTVPVHVASDAFRYVHGSSLSRTQSSHNGSNGYGTNSRHAPDVSTINQAEKGDNYYNSNKDSDSQLAMKTFYNKNHPISEVSPYAMANVVAGNNLLTAQSPDSAFRPINRGGYMKTTSDGSSDSCLKHGMHSDSNTENSRPNTGSTELPHDDGVLSPLSECQIAREEDALLQCYLPNYRGAPPPSARVNFMDIAPPPPEYPPPSDIGTPPDTPPRGRSPAVRLDRSYGRNVPMQRPSPHSTIHSQKSNGSNGSRKTVNSKASSGHHSTDNERRGIYAQQPARTQVYNSSDSSKSRGKNRSQSPKKYSHSSNSENERGPTPPVRAYKLVPINNVNELKQSDTERGPTPPIRMYAIHSPSSPSSATAPGMDRGIQSSLPSLGSDSVRSPTGARLEIGEHGPEFSLYNASQGSPPSEGIPDYVEESDLDVGQRTDCGSPTSSVDMAELNTSMTGSMMAAWASVTDHSDTNCSSVRSSAASSSDGSFLAEADFASAVARAAELSGMTVVGSTVVDPQTGSGQQRHRKRRERPQRPTSPYSTDSNFSTIPHKPYPKSHRKKQLQSQGSRNNGALSHYKVNSAYTSKPMTTNHSLPPQNVGDLPAYHRPTFPSPSHNSHASTSPRSAPSTGSSRPSPRTYPTTVPIHRENGYTGRPNPLASYNIDEENTSKV